MGVCSAWCIRREEMHFVLFRLEGLMPEKGSAMTVTKISLKPMSDPARAGRVNTAQLEGNTVKQIAAQAAQDDAAAAQDAAQYARRVRERLGLT